MRRIVIMLGLAWLASLVCVRALPTLAIQGEDPLTHNCWLPLVCDAPRTGPPPYSAVRVSAACSQFDAPGDDRDNLSEEYVCLQNYGDQAVQLEGWQIRDLAGATYIWPVFELPPHGFVRLRTGSGTNTATDVYWGLNRAVWNNDHDTVFVYDAQGILVDEYVY
jgi:hypothetical protein